MRFNRNFDIAAIIGKGDVTRPYLCEAWYDVATATLTATNGAALVRLPVEPESGDTTGFIAPDAVKRATKAAKRGADAQIVATADSVQAAGLASARSKVADLGEYPDVDRAIPADCAEPADLWIDAELLAKLQKAMGAYGVGLRFQRADDGTPRYDVAVTVRSRSDTAGPLGVIMPMRDPAGE